MRALAWAIALVVAAAFVALAVVMLSPESHIRVPALAALVTLAAVELAFMGGMQSGAALAREEAGAAAAVAMGLGWIVALGGFAVFWIGTTGPQLACALALFALAFAIDAWLVRRALLPRWFLAVRVVLTLALLGATGLALWRA